MAQVAVSKEYVRQQLNAMGVRELSEEDLEAYTNGEFLPRAKGRVSQIALSPYQIFLD